jgi:glutamyl-tRNA reductase
MVLAVLGLNHKTAPVEVRECLACPEESVKQALRRLEEHEDILECVVLSTCNRTEVYAVMEDVEDPSAVLVEFLERLAGPADYFFAPEHLFYYVGDECIRHLFRVAGSIDSLVIGEGQILSQVKKAYLVAKDCCATSTVLNTLFHRAIAAGKKIRTETRIAYNAVSISYAAVELAKKLLGDLSNANVMVLGAGEVSELTARNLVENGVKTVFVSNRNHSRAEELAQKFHGQAVPFEKFMKWAAQTDIIITSTGAPHYVVRAWDVAHIMPQRAGRPLIFIDIAVPRDVEPEVAAIAGVSLYNIDSLNAVVDSNRRERLREARKAEKILEAEAKELIERFRYLSYQPVLSQIKDKAEAIRQREMKRALTKLPELSAEDRRIMENMSRMLVRKLLRDPVICTNEAAARGEEEFCVQALTRLFKLNELGAPTHCEVKNHRRHARQ